jgi:hypothetical protein
MPNDTGQAVPARNWHRTVRIVLLCVIVAAIVLIAAAGFLRG